MQIDYLIVGQGLAGTLLAAELASRGLSYLMVDDRHRFASSVVAAGLYTPVTGQRLVLTWRAAEMLSVASSVYKDLESAHGVSFFHAVNTARIFQHEKEQALWEAKQDDAALQPYIGKRSLPEELNVPAPFGGFELAGSGWADLNTLLQIVPDDHRVGDRFEVADCEVSDEGVRWRDIQARRLVMCEGFQAEANPWFDRLPFRHAHGELLTVRIPDLAETHIVNAGIFLLPLGEQLFRVGATYDWDVPEPRTTVEGRQHLLGKLAALMPFPVEVVDHQAGIRPIATQRVPVVGCHPDMPSIAMFNGLGSKGVLYAPFYARQLVTFFEAGGSIDPEVLLANRMKDPTI